jgi:hydrogenase expression/formation protein HypD
MTDRPDLAKVDVSGVRRTINIGLLRPYFEWRGLGFISHSSLRVREA